MVVLASGKSVPGDDGLGEGEDRLEPVKDLPSPCPACTGSGRQRIGATGPSRASAAAARGGEEHPAEPNYFCLYPIIVFQCGSTAAA